MNIKLTVFLFFLLLLLESIKIYHYPGLNFDAEAASYGILNVSLKQIHEYWHPRCIIKLGKPTWL